MRGGDEREWFGIVEGWDDLDGCVSGQKGGVCVLAIKVLVGAVCVGGGACGGCGGCVAGHDWDENLRAVF